MRLYLKELFIKPIYSIFLFLGFCVSIYCILIVFGFLKANQDFYVDNNKLWNNHFIATFNSNEFVTLNDITNKLIDKNLEFSTGHYNVDLTKTRITRLIGVHEELNTFRNSYPLKSGRYFTNEELNSDSKIALVGNNLSDLIYIKNKQKYIDVRNVTYRVIGILGKETNSYYDIYVFTPPRSLPEEVKNIKSKDTSILLSNIYLDDNKFLYKLKKSINLPLISIGINTYTPTNSYLKAYADYRDTYFDLFLGIILSILSITSSTFFWINDMKKIYSIKRILGATNKDILKSILFQILTLVSSATIVTILLYKITMNYLQKMFNTYVSITPLNLISGILFAILMSIFLSIYMLRNVLKFKIIEQ